MLKQLVVGIKQLVVGIGHKLTNALQEQSEENAYCTDATSVSLGRANVALNHRLEFQVGWYSYLPWLDWLNSQ